MTRATRATRAPKSGGRHKAKPPPPASAAPKRGPGAKPFVPTAAQRLVVRIGAATNVPHAVMGAMIGVSQDTIERHFKDELRDGRERIKASIGIAIARKAMTGDVGAGRYWMSCWGGKEWQPTENRHLTGRVGFVGSDEELDERIAELERADAAAATGRARLSAIQDEPD